MAIDIKITLDENDINLKNLPFCYANYNILEKEKNNKYKKQGFLIFTYIFLLKIFASSKKIYIDATFKITPKSYYQL